MIRWQPFVRAAFTAAIVAWATAAVAADDPKGDEVKRSGPSWATVDCDKMGGWFKSQCQGLGAAWTRGRTQVLLSGYLGHDPSTYDADSIEEFNQKAWGGGLGYGRFDEKGDNYSWYGLAFRDSHDDYTAMGGWAWTTYWPEKSDIAVGLGYAAFLMSRPDIMKNFPFPGIVPIASLKLGPAEVIGTYIPNFNGGPNHGDIAYLFLRLNF